MRRSASFGECERRLGWWFALWLVLSGLRRPSTLEPVRGDSDIPHARNFRNGFQVVDRLLAPVRSWADQFSDEFWREREAAYLCATCAECQVVGRRAN